MGRLPSNAPVVAWDIDGTLAEYYNHFHRFCEAYLQRPVPLDWSRRHRGEFSEALGLEKEEYRRIKLAYRQGGQKRMLMPMQAAGETLREQRRMGVRIWICTTRPWNFLNNIDPDTQFWLETHIGRVDGVIYGEEKYEDLIEQVGRQRILGVVDDLPENFIGAKKLGLNALLMAGAHNAWFRETLPRKPRSERMPDVILRPSDSTYYVQRWLNHYNNKERK